MTPDDPTTTAPADPDAPNRAFLLEVARDIAARYKEFISARLYVVSQNNIAESMFKPPESNFDDLAARMVGFPNPAADTERLAGLGLQFALLLDAELSLSELRADNDPPPSPVFTLPERLTPIPDREGIIAAAAHIAPMIRAHFEFSAQASREVIADFGKAFGSSSVERIAAVQDINRRFREHTAALCGGPYPDMELAELGAHFALFIADTFAPVGTPPMTESAKLSGRELLNAVHRITGRGVNITTYPESDAAPLSTDPTRVKIMWFRDVVSDEGTAPSRRRMATEVLWGDGGTIKSLDDALRVVLELEMVMNDTGGNTDDLADCLPYKVCPSWGYALTDFATALRDATAAACFNGEEALLYKDKDAWYFLTGEPSELPADCPLMIHPNGEVVPFHNEAEPPL